MLYTVKVLFTYFYMETKLAPNKEFTAWSIYTGPSFSSPIINDERCPWIVGTWDAVNADTSISEIKKDIDQRIEVILEELKRSILRYVRNDRYFVIPEFFFRCKQGPYPYLKLDGEHYPFEYIQSQLQMRLRTIIPEDSNAYTIVVGSILTSDVADYDTFLNSDPVQERLGELNAFLAGKLTRSNEVADFIWHRNSFFESTLLQANPDLDGLNRFMKSCRTNPLCTVRNRGICLRYDRGETQEPQIFLYEKQYESTVDLTMGVLEGGVLKTGGMITEWMANYPSSSTQIYGDKQRADGYSMCARFTPDALGQVDFGVEICLDHRLQRLKRTVNMTMANNPGLLLADNYPVAVQLIPSGGMQILDYSVAVDSGAAIFNADGCDMIYKDYTDSHSNIPDGPFNGIVNGVYCKAIQSLWKEEQSVDHKRYHSHSQLAYSNENAAAGDFDNALGLKNPIVQTCQSPESDPTNRFLDQYVIEVIPTNATEAPLFAAGMGELHYYYAKGYDA
jgi:hypothetical protein